MLALSGLAAESMVQDVGWTMMDIGKRIERGLALTALLRATLTTVRSPGAEQTITESDTGGLRVLGHLPPAQSRQVQCGRGGGPGAVRRREPAVAGLSVRAAARRPQDAPGSSGRHGRSGWSTSIGARLRRLDPADLEDVTADGTRGELADLLDGMHDDLREFSGVITATHLSLPGGMQPLWGPDERREMP